MVKVILVIIAGFPYFIVNLKYKYDKAIKKHSYCCVLFFITLMYVIKDMSEINILFAYSIIFSSFSLLYSIPLYIKNKENVKALQNIVKLCVGIFVIILGVTIITYFDIN